MQETQSPYGLPSDYLPQKPPMQVISRIVSITESQAVCETDPGADGPLEVFADEKGRIPAEIAIELLAQCVGVWAGYQRREANKKAPEAERDAAAGFLLSVRAMKVSEAGIPRGAPLRITMRKLVYEESMGSFEGEVRAEGVEVASGRVSVFQPKARDLERLRSGGVLK